MDEDSVFVVFSIVNECDDILINCPNGLFGAKVNNVLMLLGNCYLLNLQCTKTISTDVNFGTSSPSLS